MDELLSFDDLLEFNKNYKNPTNTGDNEYVLFLKDIYLGTATPGEITINIDSQECKGIKIYDLREGALNLNGFMSFVIVKTGDNKLIKLPYGSATAGSPPGPILTNARVNLGLSSNDPVFRKMIFSEYKKIEDVKNTAVSARETLGQAKDFATQALNRGFRMFGKETSKETSKETGGRKRRTHRKRSTKSKRRRG